MKFREIEEKNLCPKCGRRLFYKMMPATYDYELMLDYRARKHAYYCSNCDKYFDAVAEKDNYIKLVISYRDK
jgi:DNA-directed RNA polymerase subunit RPC12/RpoP